MIRQHTAHVFLYTAHGIALDEPPIRFERVDEHAHLLRCASAFALLCVACELFLANHFTLSLTFFLFRVIIREEYFCVAPLIHTPYVNGLFTFLREQQRSFLCDLDLVCRQNLTFLQAEHVYGSRIHGTPRAARPGKCNGYPCADIRTSIDTCSVHFRQDLLCSHFSKKQVFPRPLTPHP